MLTLYNIIPQQPGFNITFYNGLLLKQLYRITCSHISVKSIESHKSHTLFILALLLCLIHVIEGNIKLIALNHNLKKNSQPASLSLIINLISLIL